ncbi:MAG: hypothetical protein Q8N90_00385 [bacterium]|nr:hypothetical protein [bacterium]
MYDIKYLIKKKLNKMGLRQKFDERAVCFYARQFLKENLKNINVRVVSYFHGNLMIEAQSAVEANELHFFEEELKFFLENKGYKIKKIRVVS